MEALNLAAIIDGSLDMSAIKRLIREHAQQDRAIKHLRDLLILHYEKSKKTIEELTNMRRALQNKIKQQKDTIEGLEEEIVKLQHKNKVRRRRDLELEELPNDPYSDISVSTDVGYDDYEDLLSADGLTISTEDY